MYSSLPYRDLCVEYLRVNYQLFNLYWLGTPMDTRVSEIDDNLWKVDNSYGTGSYS